MKPSSEYLPFTFLLVLLNRPASAVWSTTLPGIIKALRGSCVVIPCSFTFPGSRDSWGDRFSVAWYQYHSFTYPEIYNSKTAHSVLAAYRERTELLGDLEMGNCTLSISPVQREDAMSYYVWINPDSVKHPFYGVTVQLEVTDVPNQPELSDPGLVTEGIPTQVTCSVLHTCPLSPPVLTWNLGEAKNVTIQERLAGGSWRTESSFTYIPSQKDHGRDLQCTATFPNMQQSHRRTNLKVQYSPRNVTVSVVGNRRLKEGGGAVLRCNSLGNPTPARYHWFFGPHRTPMKVSDSGPELKLVDIRRDSGPYLCAAENDLGVGEDSPPTYLSVEYKPMIRPQSNCTVSKPRQLVTCYCVAEGNPTPRVEWQLPDGTVRGDFNSSEMQASLTPLEQTVVGLLRMARSFFINISCRATNQHGTTLVLLPTAQAAGGAVVFFIGFGGVVASLLIFCLLGVVINRKKKKRGGEKEEQEEENPRTYGNVDWKISPKAQRPFSDKEEEQPNMYSKPNSRGSQAANNELSITKTYEIMEMVEDYENISPSEGPDHRGNPGNWEFTSGSDQIYSNV